MACLHLMCMCLAAHTHTHTQEVCVSLYMYNVMCVNQQLIYMYLLPVSTQELSATYTVEPH